MWVYFLIFPFVKLFQLTTVTRSPIILFQGSVEKTTHNNKNDHAKYLKRMCLRTGSNRGSSVYETDALPLGHEGWYSQDMITIW